MTTKYALEKAAQAWCTDKTGRMTMNSVLAEAFANILDAEIERLEQYGVQLGACSVAALGHVVDPAVKGQYAWSPAYQDVLDLRLQYDKLVDLGKGE